MKKDNLDRILKEWAATHTMDEAHAEALEDRILADAAGRRLLFLADPSDRGRIGLWHRLVYAALGAAAAVLVMVLAMPKHDTRQDKPVDADGASCQLIPFSESEVAANARLFREMRAVFPQNLKWVASSDNDLRVGVEPVRDEVLTDAPATFVRVVVIGRSGSEERWRRLWGTDVLMYSEEVVEVIPDPTSGNRLLLWAYPVSEELVAVDSEVVLAEPIRVAVSTSQILQHGKPAQIASLSTADAEYRVLQMATVLRNGGV